MEDKALEGLTGAMFHLRMRLAGHSGYSGTPSNIDKGWAMEVADALQTYGCKVVWEQPVSGGNRMVAAQAGVTRMGGDGEAGSVAKP